MKLGNSGGKNKGKKYLKITGNETIIEENRIKADNFNTWFALNSKKLQQQLFYKYSDPLNEDVFIDTYIKIQDKILYSGLQIIDNTSYFCRAFYTNYIQQRVSRNKFISCDVSEAYDIEIETSEEDMIDSKIESLIARSKIFVEINYPEASELFYKWITSVMATHKKRGIIRKISEEMGIKESKVGYELRKIKKSLGIDNNIQRLRKDIINTKQYENEYKYK